MAPSNVAPQNTKYSGQVSHHILAVEDNPVMASILSKLLTRFPVTFDIVSDGQAAIQQADDNLYDLILMDILMPKVGGVTASREIRKISAHYRDIPIIAVTARVSERNIDEYLSEGMSGVIKKPVNRINLATTLRQFLDIEEKVEHDQEMVSETRSGNDDLDALNWDIFNEYRALLGEHFGHFLKEYLTIGPDMLNEIGSAITDDDAAQIQFLSHKLKSTAQVFGAESVSDLAAQLEIMGKNHNTQQAPHLFHEMHIAYERTQRALRKKYVLMQNMG